MTDNRNGIRIRVGAAIIVEDRLLLVSHIKEGKIYWLLPGGGVDYGENLEEAIIRELYEELSIKREELNVEDVLFCSDSISPDGSRHIFNVVFWCETTCRKFTIGNDPRLHDFGFFSYEEVRAMKTYPSLVPVADFIFGLKKSHRIYYKSEWLP